MHGDLFIRIAIIDAGAQELEQLGRKAVHPVEVLERRSGLGASGVEPQGRLVGLHRPRGVGGVLRDLERTLMTLSQLPLARYRASSWALATEFDGDAARTRS
jgi:hypothetical protein